MGYVSVKALRPFYGSVEKQVDTGQVFEASEGYANDLAKRGLVEIVASAPPPAAPHPVPQGASIAPVVVSGAPTTDTAKPVVATEPPVTEESGTKANPAPDNKMKPGPANKAS